MEKQDKMLPCKSCGEEFVFTAGEQQFYEDKGFENEPARCSTCRRERKARYNQTQNENNN